MPFRPASVTVALSLLLGASAPALAGSRPVVVELFTSEGCSSCPPAEAYLNRLATEPGVLPLAFHVTYWDRLGWRDLYSLEAATERQARYGAHFGDGSYTPEMVVDGTRHFVGSSEGDGASAIRAASASQRDAAAMSLVRDGGGVSVHVGAGQGSGRILLVGFDRQHQTAVKRGENAGRTITESDVVRSVRTLGTWSGAPVDVHAGSPGGSDAAVLLEAPDGSIVGAARLGG